MDNEVDTRTELPPVGSESSPVGGADWSTQQPAAPQPVWPPQPFAAHGGVPPTLYRFAYVHERVGGHVSDFREGSIGFAPEGITILGRMQPRAEIYQPIMIACFLLFRGIGALIAFLIMRNSCLRNETQFIPWHLVKGITTVPKKRTLCVQFDAPNQAGKVMTFSLAMKFPPEEFAIIEQSLATLAPGLALPGKLKAINSLYLYAVLVALLVVIAIGAVKFLSAPGH